jgi:hypothetical protein
LLNSQIQIPEISNAVISITSRQDGDNKAKGCRLFQLFCVAILAATVYGPAMAADWFGLLNSDFLDGNNWRPDPAAEVKRMPEAGKTNTDSLVIRNGSQFPLIYGADLGDTKFQGQLLVGASGGAQGEVKLTGGSLVIAQDRYPSIIGQTVPGKVTVTGGTLSFVGGAVDSPAIPGIRWGLFLGNEERGTGNLEISGGEVFVEGSVLIGRNQGAGILKISGTGSFDCGGSIVFATGFGQITIGPGSGMLRLSGTGSIQFGIDGSSTPAYIDFKNGSRGKMCVKGRDRAYCDALVKDMLIRINGLRADPKRFVFKSVSGYGEYSLVP